jgi:hypothetical protein
VYVAFRLAAHLTVAEAAGQLDVDAGQRDDKVGYLNQVDLLANLPTVAQLKLLADVWRLHAAPTVRQATFLEAAVAFAACRAAAELIRSDPDRAREYLAAAPQRVFAPVSRRLADRVEETFKAFWEETDYLTGDEPWPHTPAEQQAAEAARRLPEASFAPLDAAKAALIANDAPDLRLEDLLGVLAPEEICHAAAVLEIDVPVLLLRQ